MNAIAASETALVLIEYQNDFMSEGGVLHEGVRGEMARTKMLPHTKTLVEKVRTLGIKVVWVPISFAPGHPELGASPYGILGNVKAANAFVAGEWGSAIVDELTPHESDLIVAGKRGLCGFASTNLDFILRHNGVKRIALGGFLTNCCVESTMRTAYEYGYDVITLTDCTATLSEAQHEAAVKFTYPMFSTPLDHEAFLAFYRT